MCVCAILRFAQPYGYGYGLTKLSDSILWGIHIVISDHTSCFLLICQHKPRQLNACLFYFRSVKLHLHHTLKYSSIYLREEKVRAERRREMLRKVNTSLLTVSVLIFSSLSPPIKMCLQCTCIKCSTNYMHIEIETQTRWHCFSSE